MVPPLDERYDLDKGFGVWCCDYVLIIPYLGAEINSHSRLGRLSVSWHILRRWSGCCEEVAGCARLHAPTAPAHMQPRGYPTHNRPNRSQGGRGVGVHISRSAHETRAGVAPANGRQPCEHTMRWLGGHI